MTDESKLRLELTPEAVDGVYTNFSVITHTGGEFIIDFARTVPGKSVAKVYSRIIMSPINFKLFSQAVSENLQNYERKFGKINSAIKSDEKKDRLPDVKIEMIEEPSPPVIAQNNHHDGIIVDE